MWMIVSLLLISPVPSHADPKSCLDPLAVQEVIESTVEQLAPLVITLDTTLQVSYTPNSGPIMAYAWAKDPKATEIRIQGTRCDSLFFREEIQMLLCHELGHLAGGEPFMNFHGSSAKISAEGQSDFFAVSACLPFLWKKEIKKIRSETAVRPEATEYCKKNDNPLCERLASAALNFQEYQHLLAKKEGGNRTPPVDPGPKPRLAHWDQRKVRKTLLREYPSAQCRLDIMKVGIDCEAIQLPTNFHRSPSAPLACSDSVQNAPIPACYRANSENP